MNSVLELDRIEKRFGTRTAVSGLSLSLPGGEIFGFLGPNGAGKTTTFKMIAGLLRPTAGTVRVLGMDVGEFPVETKRVIGFVPDTPLLYEKLTAIEYLRFVADLYEIPRSEADRKGYDLLRMFDLDGVAEDLIDSFSHGMKQKTALAGALLHDPKLLILDEPTAGVDIELRRSMWGFLREINRNGTTIILTTHYLEEAESLCRNIAIIDRGELIANTSVRALLNKLHIETFVFDLKQPVDAAPSLPGYAVRLSDPTTMEIDISKEKPINAVFETLSARGILVVSMRNKVNRLEELFIKMVSNSARKT
jgi:ABC-2 type transport system ATP-binding protein